MQVRMMSKGVIKAIVPWRSARRVLSTRLRCRLAEESLLGHIASADPSISRPQALLLLRKWNHDSSTNASPSPAPVGTQPTAEGSSSKSAESSNSYATLTETLAAEEHEIGSHSDDGGGAGGGGTEVVSADALVQADEAFLRWMESTKGAARVGSELRKMKRCAAATVIEEAAQSEEGRDGLLLVLESLVQSDARLKAQLEVLLS
jgi:hypothetical protein